MKAIDNLRSISDLDSEADIMEKLMDCRKFYIPNLWIPAYTVAYRARLSAEKFLLKSEKDLSINPFPAKETSRACPIGYNVFYCCGSPYIFTNKNQLLESAIYEGSSLSKYCCDTPKFEDGFVSNWVTQKILNVAAIIYHDFNVENFALNQYKKIFFNQLTYKLGDPKYYIEINKIMAKFFTKPYKPDNPNKYRVSSIYSKFLIEQCGYDGIVYPGIHTRGATWNMALSKNVINNIKLKNFMKVKTKNSNGVLDVTVIDQNLRFKLPHEY